MVMEQLLELVDARNKSASVDLRRVRILSGDVQVSEIDALSWRDASSNTRLAWASSTVGVSGTSDLAFAAGLTAERHASVRDRRHYRLILVARDSQGHLPQEVRSIVSW